jgi:hypothetical protein
MDPSDAGLKNERGDPSGPGASDGSNGMIAMLR